MLSEEPGSRRGGRNPPVGTAPAPCRGQVPGPTGAAPWLVPVCYCSPWGQTSTFFNLILILFLPNLGGEKWRPGDALLLPQHPERRARGRWALGKAGALHPPNIWGNAAGWCVYMDFIPLAGLARVGAPPPEPLGACCGLGRRPWLWAGTKHGAVRRDPPSPRWGKHQRGADGLPGRALSPPASSARGQANAARAAAAFPLLRNPSLQGASPAGVK